MSTPLIPNTLTRGEQLRQRYCVTPEQYQRFSGYSQSCVSYRFNSWYRQGQQSGNCLVAEVDGVLRMDVEYLQLIESKVDRIEGRIVKGHLITEEDLAVAFCRNLSTVVQDCRLPELSEPYREYRTHRTNRIDLLCDSGYGKAIVEIKQRRTYGPPYEAIGQLLFYRELLRAERACHYELILVCDSPMTETYRSVLDCVKDQIHYVNVLPYLLGGKSYE